MSVYWSRLAAAAEKTNTMAHTLRIGCFVVTLGSSLMALPWQDAPPSTATAPIVYGADVDSIIHPVSEVDLSK